MVQHQQLSALLYPITQFFFLTETVIIRQHLLLVGTRVDLLPMSELDKSAAIAGMNLTVQNSYAINASASLSSYTRFERR